MTRGSFARDRFVRRRASRRIDPSGIWASCLYTSTASSSSPSAASSEELSSSSTEWCGELALAAASEADGAGGSEYEGLRRYPPALAPPRLAESVEAAPMTGDEALSGVAPPLGPPVELSSGSSGRILSLEDCFVERLLRYILGGSRRLGTAKVGWWMEESVGKRRRAGQCDVRRSTFRAKIHPTSRHRHRQQKERDTGEPKRKCDFLGACMRYALGWRALCPSWFVVHSLSFTHSASLGPLVYSIECQIATGMVLRAESYACFQYAQPISATWSTSVRRSSIRVRGCTTRRI